MSTSEQPTPVTEEEVVVKSAGEPLTELDKTFVEELGEEPVQVLSQGLVQEVFKENVQETIQQGSELCSRHDLRTRRDSLEPELNSSESRPSHSESHRSSSQGSSKCRRTIEEQLEDKIYDFMDRWAEESTALWKDLSVITTKHPIETRDRKTGRHSKGMGHRSYISLKTSDKGKGKPKKESRAIIGSKNSPLMTFEEKSLKELLSSVKEIDKHGKWRTM